jgi:hypothetical protein
MTFSHELCGQRRAVYLVMRMLCPDDFVESINHVERCLP